MAIECGAYVIVEIKTINTGDKIEGGIAIARAKSERTPAQWVTWDWHMTSNGPTFYWGHYFGEEDRAWVDFYDRCKENHIRRYEP